MDMGSSCRKNAFCQASIKIDAPISGPRIADKNFTDTRIFLRKVQNLEILEILESLEILENPPTVEKKGESDLFLEIPKIYSRFKRF